MSFTLFLLLTSFIGIITVGGVFFAYSRSRDSFHPLIYLGLMLFVLYCYIPFNLFRSNLGELLYFLSVEQLEYVQILNLLGIISIFAGVLCGDKQINRLHYSYSGQIGQLPPRVKQRIQQGAILCGIIGVCAYTGGILGVGGFGAAYGRSYGGGWSASGYAREAIILTLPALLWLMATRVRQRLSSNNRFWIVFFTLPLLIQGLLGARRGPTAMILVSLVMGWHLVRMRRPNLFKTIISAIALGMLMLFLVTNRSNIYLGSDFNFETPMDNYVMKVHAGNEFIYGSGVILDANARGKYFWGKRYLTIFFVRPIPKELWMTKYQDAADFFHIPNLELGNLGLEREALSTTMGWHGAYGAAPGLIADVWVEFCWLYLVVLFLIGWLYGMAWRKVITRGGLWIPIYTIMTALSVYLIMQTLEAMAFRFLFTGAATWLIWRHGISSSYPKYLSSPEYSLHEHQ